MLGGPRMARLGSNGSSGARGKFLPAFQSIHKLSWCLQAFAHEMRLLLDDCDGIVQQPSLIFHSWRGGHGDVLDLNTCTMAFSAHAMIVDVDVGKGIR
jgi:hypothetical protein